MAKLVKVRLSRNSDRVVNALGGINGEASATEKGRKFVVLEFEDDQNIFKVSRAVRTYWMNGEGENEKWAGVSPEKLQAYEGKTVPGKFVTEQVLPYEIVGDDGITRTVEKYTAFVMPHEIADDVISNEHTIVSGDGSVRVEKKNKETQPATIA